MYKLEKARKCKTYFAVLAFVCFVFCIIGYGAGGSELLEFDSMNHSLASIVMVVSFFCMVICVLATITIHALEKDIAEWLEILDKE